MAISKVSGNPYRQWLSLEVKLYLVCLWAHWGWTQRPGQQQRKRQIKQSSPRPEHSVMPPQLRCQTKSLERQIQLQFWSKFPCDLKKIQLTAWVPTSKMVIRTFCFQWVLWYNHSRVAVCEILQAAMESLWVSRWPLAISYALMLNGHSGCMTR